MNYFDDWQRLQKTVTVWTFVVIAMTLLVGCGERVDGHRMWNMLVWMGEHPALAGVIVALTTPLIAMIPVVGVPFSAIWAKIGVAVIPALKQIAEAVEADEDAKLTKSNPNGRAHLDDRSIGDAAAVAVGRLANDNSAAATRVPGGRLLAGIAARGLIRRERRRRRRNST